MLAAQVRHPPGLGLLRAATLLAAPESPAGWGARGNAGSRVARTLRKRSGPRAVHVVAALQVFAALGIAARSLKGSGSAADGSRRLIFARDRPSDCQSVHIVEVLVCDSF
jgi:hypothetical protein